MIPEGEVIAFDDQACEAGMATNYWGIPCLKESELVDTTCDG